MTVRKLPFVLLTIFLPTICASWAGAGPRAVVEEYCKLDYDGTRIGVHPDYAVKIPPLVAWLVEPGWDSSVLVSSYIVGDAICEGSIAWVIVKYSTIGRTEGNSAMVFTSGQERVEFRLVRRGTVWIIDRINEGLLPPHVSVSAKILNLELILKQEVSDSRRKLLLNDLERLRRLQ